MFVCSVSTGVTPEDGNTAEQKQPLDLSKAAIFAVSTKELHDTENGEDPALKQLRVPSITVQRYVGYRIEERKCNNISKMNCSVKYYCFIVLFFSFCLQFKSKLYKYQISHIKYQKSMTGYKKK